MIESDTERGHPARALRLSHGSLAFVYLLNWITSFDKTPVLAKKIDSRGMHMLAYSDRFNEFGIRVSVFPAHAGMIPRPESPGRVETSTPCGATVVAAGFGPARHHAPGLQPGPFDHSGKPPQRARESTPSARFCRPLPGRSASPPKMCDTLDSIARADTTCRWYRHGQSDSH